jgi:hypothetical protein
MALPIRFQPLARDAREELRDRLDKAPLDHAEALLAAYEVLQGLNDRGVLDTLKGALSAGETLVETVVEVVKTPEAIRSIGNLLLLSKVFSLLRRFSSKDSRRAMGAAAEQITQLAYIAHKS